MKKLIPITFAFILAMSVSGFAQRGECGMHSGKGAGMGAHGDRGMMRGQGMGMDRLEGLADKLDLTKAQQEKLKQLRVDFKLETVDTKADLQKAKIALKALMHDDNASAASVNSAIDEVARKQAAMTKLKFQRRQSTKDVLTEEQQGKLKELRKERGQGGKDGAGDHKFGRRGERSGSHDGHMGRRRRQGR